MHHRCTPGHGEHSAKLHGWWWQGPWPHCFAKPSKNMKTLKPSKVPAPSPSAAKAQPWQGTSSWNRHLTIDALCNQCCAAPPCVLQRYWDEECFERKPLALEHQASKVPSLTIDLVELINGSTLSSLQPSSPGAGIGMVKASEKLKRLRTAQKTGKIVR